MKTIGILGGMSAASTQIYYRELCAMTRERLGGLHSPELLIRSLDFARIEALQMEGDWNSAGVILNTEARALERGGADVIVLATNTMHKLAREMMTGIKIPFVHIADATAQAIKEKGLRNPGLMATAFTMEQIVLHREARCCWPLNPIIPTGSLLSGDTSDFHLRGALQVDITTLFARNAQQPT